MNEEERELLWRIVDLLRKADGMIVNGYAFSAREPLLTAIDALIVAASEDQPGNESPFFIHED